MSGPAATPNARLGYNELELPIVVTAAEHIYCNNFVMTGYWLPLVLTRYRFIRSLPRHVSSGLVISSCLVDLVTTH